MGRLRGAGLALTVAAGVWAAPLLPAPLWREPAVGAETARVTTCKFVGMPLRLKPGLSTQEGAFRFHRIADGTVTCDGPVLGERVPHPGTWTAGFGSATGSCTGGTGVFTHKFDFRTRNGNLNLTNRGTFTFGPLAGGVIDGEFDGDKIKGSFSVFPKDGDCVTSPLTQVLGEGQGTLK